MLTVAIISFLAGTFGTLVLFLIQIHISGVTQFTAPFFVVVYGIICAVLSLLLGYWSVPIVLGIFSVLAVMEER